MELLKVHFEEDGEGEGVMATIICVSHVCEVKILHQAVVPSIHSYQPYHSLH